jgi:hypothetical protein
MFISIGVKMPTKLDTGVIHFRMNKKVKGDLERAAKEEHRSFAAQCALILEKWVEAKKNGKV